MKTIIVPTDFSHAANNAVDYAVQLAVFLNARIVLVNAYPVPMTNYETGLAVDIISTMKKSAEEKLANLKAAMCQQHECNLDIECIAEMGLPYDVIDSITDDQNADLIVMGIMGEAGTIKENIIGSTAIKVARQKQIPTFIIPENIRYHRIHKISFACDLENTEESDLIYVVKYFAKTFDATVEIVNVEKPEEVMTTERIRTNMFIETKLKNVNHKNTHIVGEDIAEKLEDHFRIHQPDLIILSPKKHNLFYYLFHHSITKELAFHANIPILAIH